MQDEKETWIDGVRARYDPVTLQLVWDMDGTLLDSSFVVPDAFIAAVAELGVADVDRAQVVAAYSLGVPEVILQHLLGRDLEPDEPEAYYRRLLHASVAPYPGIPAALTELRSSGQVIAVFTGASTRAASTLLASAGIEVDLLVGGDSIQRPKPAPDGLLRVARQLQRDPADLAYVGDAPTDLRAAKAAGALSVAARWGHLYDSAEPADVTLAAPEDVRKLIAQD